MSQENVARVRQGYEAYARGDLATLLALTDEEVEWYPAIAPLLGAGPIRGKTALARFFAVDIAEGFADLEAVPASIEDLGAAVLIQTRYSGRGKASGAPVALDTYSLCRFRGDKISSFWDYDTRAEALEAAGLEE